MTCAKLRTGMSLGCVSTSKKYYQQAVLVNREDVLNKKIITSSVSIDDEYLCRHRVFFDLKEGKTGFLFALNENTNSIYGTAEKSLVEGIPQYNHTVSIVVVGVDEETKCVLNQLDYADYFAALQFYDGTIEIFGFEYGLTAANYSYDPANNQGGMVLRLNSVAGSFEDELPFVYRSGILNNEITDFDNLFSENVYDENGDFNADFNDDFNNE